MTARRSNSRATIRRARRDLARAGVLERVGAAKRIAASPFFGPQIGAALRRAENDRPPTGPDDVAAIVRTVMTERFGVDMQDVQILVQWNPETRALGLTFVPAHARVLEALERAAHNAA